MDIERYGAKLYADTYGEPKDRSICQCIRDLTSDTHQHLPEGISPHFFLLLLAPSSTERPPRFDQFRRQRILEECEMFIGQPEVSRHIISFKWVENPVQTVCHYCNH